MEKQKNDSKPKHYAPEPQGIQRMVATDLGLRIEAVVGAGVLIEIIPWQDIDELRATLQR